MIPKSRENQMYVGVHENTPNVHAIMVWSLVIKCRNADVRFFFRFNNNIFHFTVPFLTLLMRVVGGRVMSAIGAVLCILGVVSTAFVI